MRLGLGFALQPRRGGIVVAGDPEAAGLEITTQPAGAVAGAVLTTQPALRVIDQYGDPIAGVHTVSVSIFSGPGTLQGDTAIDTEADGTVVFTDLGLSAAGTVVLRFASTGLSGVSAAPLEVGEGEDTDVDPAQSTLTATPSSIAADGIEDAELLATARNAAAEPLAGKAVVLSLELVAVDADLSLVDADQAEIPDDDTTPCNLLITVVDAEGRAIVGLPADAVLVEVSGAGNTVTQPSQPSNAGGQVLASFVSTTAGTKTVTVTVNGVELTDQPVVEVTGDTPEQPPLTFASRWDTGPGSGDDEVRDTGSTTPWDFYGTSGGNRAVVAAAGYVSGWPTTNGFKIGYTASALVTAALDIDLGAPAGDSSRYVRWYQAVIDDDSHGDLGADSYTEHGVEWDLDLGGGVFNVMRLPLNDGTWRLAIRELATGSNRYACTTALDKFATYRIECAFHFVGTTAFTFQIRVYNAAGTLILTEGDFTRISGSLAPNLADAEFPCTLANYAHFRVGTNGPSTNFPLSNPASDDLYLHGAVAVSDSGWPGPYVLNEAAA